MAYSVDTCHKTLVLDGSCPEQGVPHAHPAGGPVGHIDDHVVVFTVAAPYRETQVVADLQEDTHPLVFHDGALCAWREELIFVSVGEEVPLVVGGHLSIGLHEVHPIKVVRSLFYGDTAYDSSLLVGGHLFHPCQSAPVLLGDALGLGGKTGGEHLWQDKEITRLTADHLFDAHPVISRIRPGNVRLYYRNYHNLLIFYSQEIAGQARNEG